MIVVLVKKAEIDKMIAKSDRMITCLCAFFAFNIYLKRSIQEMRNHNFFKVSLANKHKLLNKYY